ncbi:YihA family ribosome biogenesis GTP-binding protein [Candidatus Saccharibacteria bacterium]|nr:YihA family ribosome biogenesis GTP-binding protein [Candidatus Saccharibacteria bacterium]NIV03302.1 YihA family ribosome biogenesis GTP-binding protein [Calditrichia bacterium]NIV71476.1 YihA family ribosome biogenesis GTP-binding protein [Calditrichia bacterium]NIV98024.1 YihA family ribosome biogenesis GTP-binding protein [Candidatus Saccharibacteria bacterium]NIW78314.1 YihA family ribosome biogenesis GTP-binding protein [Calditrichia bacterium]
MLKIKNPQFIKSIMRWPDPPDHSLPEVAFVGRSNVGKSSLINCLVNIKNFARVSKQPGKTRTINYFVIDNKFYLVDLPGYGYAKLSKKEQAAWPSAIENYLTRNENLLILFVLIDSKVGPKASDLLLLEWLDFHQVPYSIIATKVDKLSKGSRTRQATYIARELGLQDKDDIIFFSAKDRTGRTEVLGMMDELLNWACK